MACAKGQAAPGDPSRFDPVARYDEVANFAGSGLKLRQLSAKGVKEDGTVDLEEERYSTGVEYHFAKSISPPADAPPVGAGGSATWHQRVLVLLSKAGDVGEETDQHGSRRVVSKGMRRVEPEPDSGPPPPDLPAPKCGFAELWKQAREAGAPAGAVANIDYMNDRYAFRVSDVGFTLEFDIDCALF
ncbi:hypothetical protein ENSA5_04770 [Enhygromyxa salina]|uniref:Uncharacterized protein n=2 Tax=Enhygromyxa salina TaxID=215803 RepID=A0A2S9YIG1_9BACT|nr:hypothetical protein ENSA5_04770 [Enhygromyxa salina]